MWEPWIENKKSQKYDLFRILKYTFNKENKFTDSAFMAIINFLIHEW